MKITNCPYDHPDCELPDQVDRLRADCDTLRNLVRVDELTGLYNFRFLQNALERELERTRRTGLATGLVMVDLDHFKRINDTYGHENGNVALKEAARIWRDSIRKIDIPCRYGGEEFVIILPGTKLPDVIRTAERLRKGLASAPLQLNGESVRLTASFGAHAVNPDEDLTVRDILHHVDLFVLEAKEGGRNRVCYDRGKAARTATEVTAEERKSLLIK